MLHANGRSRPTPSLWHVPFLALILLCLVCVPCVAETKIVVGLLPGQGARKPADALFLEIQTALFKEPDLTFVEREQIDKILAEHSLGAAGLVDPTNRIRLGQWILADVLIFVDGLGQEPERSSLIQVTEAKTGITLRRLLQPEGEARKDIAGLLKEIRGALAKHAVPLKDRHILGVLGFHSEESGKFLEGPVEALNELLLSDLAQEPTVALLEREHVEHLQTERELSGFEREVRAAAILLEGGIRRGATPDRLEVTVVLRPMGGGAEKTIRVESPAEPLAEARRQILAAIQTALQVKAEALPATDPKVEAAAFARQALQWATWGNGPRAARAADAAFALDPSQSNRWLLAYMLPGADGPVPRGPSSPTLRAFHLRKEWYALQFKAIEEGQATPAGLEFLGCPQYGYNYATNDQEVVKTIDEIVTLEIESLRVFLAFCRKHYAVCQGSYWRTLRDNIGAVYMWPCPPETQQALFRECIDAMVPPPPGTTNDMYQYLTHGLTAAFQRLPSNETRCPRREFLRGLTKHKDPFVRILAYEALNDPAAAFDIVLAEMPPSHPYRSTYAAELLGFAHVIVVHKRDDGFPSSATEAEELERKRERILRAIVDSGEPDRIAANRNGLRGNLDCIAQFVSDEAAWKLATDIEALLHKHPVYYGNEILLWLPAKRQEYARRCGKDAQEVVPPAAATSTVPARLAVCEIKRLPLQLGSPLPVVLVTNDTLYAVGQAKKEEDAGEWKHCYTLTTYDLTTGGKRKEWRTAAADSVAWISEAVILNNMLYVATRGDGLVGFGLADTTTWRIGEKEGLPGLSTSPLIAFSGRLYGSVQSPDGLNSCLFEYDGETRSTRILASSKTSVKRNPLDGIPLNVSGLFGETVSNRLWLSTEQYVVTGPNARRIVRETWCYDPVGGSIVEASGWPGPSLPQGLPTKRGGLWISYVAVAYDRQQRLFTISRCGEWTVEVVLAVHGNDGSATPITTVSDGTPLPTPARLFPMSKGVLLICEDGSTFLIVPGNEKSARQVPSG